MTGGLGDGVTGRHGDGVRRRRWDAVTRRPTLHCCIAVSPRHPVSTSPRLHVSPSPRLHVFPSLRRLSASNFQLTYPRTIETSEAEHLLGFLESNRAELLRRVSAAGVQVRFPNVEVFINETTGDFVGRTGMPAWAVAATKNNHIEVQPLSLLKQRRILETTLRHELVHVLIDSMGNGQTPRWLAEGMAIHLAGEGKMIERYQQKNSMSVESVERALASAKSAAEMRSAYAGAYKLVKDLIQAEGEEKVWATIRRK